MPTLAENKTARREYELSTEIEAGLSLLGNEVKSVRGGFMKLRGSFVKIVGGNLVLINSFIPKYEKAASSLLPHDPYRTRQLLVHKKELVKMARALETKGNTLVPLSVYTAGRLIKIKVGVGRGRKMHEKKEVLKQRDIARDAKRDLKR